VNIGAHVSSRGGIERAIDNAVAIGATAMQTHPTPPQQWRPLRLDDDTLSSYHASYQRSGLRGHALHTVYLINLATPKETHLSQSVGALVHYMDLAAQLNAEWVVFHPGSHLGAGFATQLPQIHAALREVLDRTASPARLLIENSAGSGGCIGRAFEEVGQMLAASDDPRLGVCLDTQHMFASGYDIRTAATVATSIAAFDREIGLDRLTLIHANDSKRALGSNVDRHDNIGDGEIGVEGFTALLAQPRLREVPWLLEVPGSDRGGPDLEQINLVRGCAGLEPTQAGLAAAR
jgi:deoxyribonuclease-4